MKKMKKLHVFRAFFKTFLIKITTRSRFLNLLKDLKIRVRVINRPNEYRHTHK